MLYRFENCILDIERRELRRGQIVCSIEPQVFDLLHLLITNRDRAVSRDEIFKTVWRGRLVSDSVLGNRINAARSAIGDDGAQQRLIKTLRRNGFRFIGTVSEAKLETNVPIVISRGRVPLTLVVSTVGGGDDGQRGFIAKGIADDLTVALVRSRSFDVIAHNRTCIDDDDALSIARKSGSSYLIICGLRRARDEVRLTARLIDGSVGRHIWVQGFTQVLRAGFVDQDAITAQIATTIEACILAAEAKRQGEKKFDSLDAVGSVTAALALGKHRLPHNYALAERLLTRAIQLEPDSGRAHSVLAYLYGIQVLWGWKQRLSTMPLALEAAGKAIVLDGEDPWAHFSMGWALTQNRQPEEAIEEYEKALAIDPYFPMALSCLGLALGYLGQSERALVALDYRDRLKAPEVFAGQLLSARASVYACAENCREAIRAGRRSARQAPDLVSTQQHLITNYVSIGQTDEARAALKVFVRTRPNSSLSTIADALPYVRDRDFDRTLSAFYVLGLR
jgi:DNA-binding winged helix-turn-helix (wHTH) protein/tetratricopeptide (TPR) repeat protein